MPSEVRYVKSSFALLALSLCAACAEAPVTGPNGQPASKETVAEILAAKRSATVYPKWRTFPKKPDSPPTPAQINSSVVGVFAASKQQESLVGAVVWDLKDPEGMAAAMNAQIDPALAVPADPKVYAAAIAEAQILRDKATPPKLGN